MEVSAARGSCRELQVAMPWKASESQSVPRVPYVTDDDNVILRKVVCVFSACVYVSQCECVSISSPVS